jgi:hypothetical protein
MYSGLWAAPEQLIGQPVTPASDIFSFALVTIYMLTGRCLFSSNDPSEAYRQRAKCDELLDDAMRGFELPSHVGDLLKQALSIQPSLRPARAGAFAKELGRSFDSKGGSRRRMPLEPPTLTPVDGPERSSAPTEAKEPSEPGASEVATRRAPSEPPRPPSPPAVPPSGPPHRLAVSSSPQPLGDRTGYFVAMNAEGSADVTCAGGRARLRVSLVPAVGHFSIHVRGLNCFVRKKGGRASGAAQLASSGGIELVSPNQQAIASARVQFGSPAAGHHVFPVGDQLVAVGTNECPRAVAFDFGPGGECLFVYIPGDGGEQGARRWRKRGPS